jgi:DNA-binding beta-propeller fold protein YncE
MLNRKPWFLPTRSIPALLAFLVIVGCSVNDDDCRRPGNRELLYYLWGIRVPYSTTLTIIRNGVVVYMGGYLTPQQVQMYYPSTQGSGGASAEGASQTRAAASITPGSSAIVYILDKFGNLVQFDPSSVTFPATLNFSQAVTQGIAQQFALTPDHKFAFITVNSAQTAMSTGYVLVVNLNSLSLVSTIALPAGTVAGGIAITPDGTLAYVLTLPYSGSGPSVMYVIDVATQQITNTIPVNADSNLGQIAITPDGTEAYLVDSIDGGNFSIQVLDLQSNTLEPPVSIYYGSGKNLMEGYPPSYIALHPDGTRLYLAPVSGGPVLILSTITKTVTNVIPLAAGAGSVFGSQPAFTPDGVHLALMNGTELVVSVNTLTDTVESSFTLPPPPYGEPLNFSLFFTPANP